MVGRCPAGAHPYGGFVTELASPPFGVASEVTRASEETGRAAEDTLQSGAEDTVRCSGVAAGRDERHRGGRVSDRPARAAHPLGERGGVPFGADERTIRCASVATALDGRPRAA